MLVSENYTFTLKPHPFPQKCYFLYLVYLNAVSVAVAILDNQNVKCKVVWMMIIYLHF